MKNEDLIEKIGGKLAVAEYLGLSRSAVYLWFYKKPQGLEGHIPTKYAIRLYEIAKEKGIKCNIRDFLGE